MTYHTMPTIKLWRDNRILRPDQQTEARARKIGTAKRVGYAMAYRFIRRLDKECVA